MKKKTSLVGLTMLGFVLVALKRLKKVGNSLPIYKDPIDELNNWIETLHFRVNNALVSCDSIVWRKEDWEWLKADSFQKMVSTPPFSAAKQVSDKFREDFNDVYQDLNFSFQEAIAGLDRDNLGRLLRALNKFRGGLEDFSRTLKEQKEKSF